MIIALFTAVFADQIGKEIRGKMEEEINVKIQEEINVKIQEEIEEMLDYLTKLKKEQGDFEVKCKKK
jgi:hypothetical protein